MSIFALGSTVNHRHLTARHRHSNLSNKNDFRARMSKFTFAICLNSPKITPDTQGGISTSKMPFPSELLRQDTS